MTEEKLDALKNLLMYLADKVASTSIEDYELYSSLVKEVNDAFHEESDLL